MESSIEVPQNTKNRTAIRFGTNPGHISKGM
jgi:hypothetical protein